LEINGYNSAWSTGKEGKEVGNRDHIEELCDEDGNEEVGQGDSSAEKVDVSDMEEEEERDGS
jgi:hypothetical protein